jgi:hypothetical protein
MWTLNGLIHLLKIQECKKLLVHESTALIISNNKFLKFYIIK